MARLDALLDSEDLSAGVIMPTRRKFIRNGLQAVALGLLGRHAIPRTFASVGRRPPSTDLAASRPFLKVPRLPRSVIVQGLPFAEGFSGDTWDFTHIPFHSGENLFPGGAPPEPTEIVDVAIVGGGLSGLATAYLLRHRHPVVFELRPRFGACRRERCGDPCPIPSEARTSSHPTRGPTSRSSTVSSVSTKSTV